jgi:RND family efflux transporter MFP subunit
MKTIRMPILEKGAPRYRRPCDRSNERAVEPRGTRPVAGVSDGLAGGSRRCDIVRARETPAASPDFPKMPVDQNALNSLRIERGAPASADGPRLRPAWLAAAGAILLAGGGAVWFFSRAEAVEVETVTAQGVGADAARPGAVLNASGYVVARRLATVSAKVTGKVEEIMVEEGMAVKADQVLARLDDTTARAQYDVARRRLDAARRNLAEVRVRLADARRAFERRRTLRASGLVSQDELDTAEAEMSALAARLEALEGEAAVEASNVEFARVGLEDHVVRAPFAGVVTSKDAQPGEMISPVSAGGGFTRTGIATIVDMDSREIEVDVNEAFINRVRAGQRAEATLDAYPDWAIPAHVINIVPTADRQKATVRVRIAFDGLDARILPDMGVKVQFLDDGPAQGAVAGRQLVQLPAEAVARNGSESIVWVVRGDEVERRAVRIGGERGGRVDVLAGVNAGETVVAKPVEGLSDGGRVKIRKPT